VNRKIIFHAEGEKYYFLLNDLVAADWVLHADIQLPDDIIVTKFMEIHQAFLHRLGRKEKSILKKMTTGNLAKIVRGWIILYRRTLHELELEFPRSIVCTDMICSGINWSEKLKVSAVGLMLIDHSSRYAEYWAERSVKTRDGYDSLQSRLSFVGSYVYKEYAKLVRRGDLLILDGFSNGVTSYDMMLFIRESGCTPDTFLFDMKKSNWRLERGNSKVVEHIFRIYASLRDNDWRFLGSR